MWVDGEHWAEATASQPNTSSLSEPQLNTQAQTFSVRLISDNDIFNSTILSWVLDLFKSNNEKQELCHPLLLHINSVSVKQNNKKNTSVM